MRLNYKSTHWGSFNRIFIIFMISPNALLVRNDLAKALFYQEPLTLQVREKSVIRCKCMLWLKPKLNYSDLLLICCAAYCVTCSKSKYWSFGVNSYRVIPVQHRD